MAKPTIVTRATKGSALTWTEGDANITNLKDATIAIKAGSAGTSVVSDLNGEITFVAGSNITLTGDNTAKTVTIDATGGGSTANFTFTTNTITSTGAISLVPDTAANVVIDGLNWPATDGTNGQVIKTNGAGDLSFTTITPGITSVSQDTGPTLGGNLNTSGYNLYTTNNANITLAPNGTGKVQLSGLNYPTADGSANQVIKTDGAGNLSFTTISSGATNLDGLSDVVLGTPATGEVLYFNGTNWIDSPLSGLTAGVASTVTLTSDNTTNASNYILFANATTGNLSPRTDNSLTYNPSTNTLSLAALVVAGITATDAVTMTSANQVINLSPTNTSGTVTIAPGTLTGSINNMNIGASTPGTGAFTTLSSNSTTTFSGAVTSSGSLTIEDLRETVFTLTYGATITPNVTNGTVQKVTLTGNVTFSAFTSPVAGQSLTLIITQDATGSRILTSTMKFSGGAKTLTTTANAIDILTVFYDGTTYFASLGKGFA